jgi:hypothetical protein
MRRKHEDIHTIRQTRARLTHQPLSKLMDIHLSRDDRMTTHFLLGSTWWTRSHLQCWSW